MGQSLNRTLYIADNLPVLRGIDSESIDLIATDPPFNKGVKAFEGITAAGENVSYSDVWTWGDVQVEWTNSILGNHPALYSVIQAANAGGGDDMGAFLCWLGVRVLEMHRILKPTGSLWMHCDSTAAHYLKAMLDAVFGRRNFRNEVAWLRRQESHNLGRKQMTRAHDTIFWYGKSPDAGYNIQFTPYSAEYVETHYKMHDERGRYATFPCTNETGGNRPYEFRGITRAWRFSPERMEAMYEQGLLTQATPTSPFRYKKYLDPDAGVKVSDICLLYTSPSPRDS